MGGSFDLEGRREKINKLEQLTSAPDFWADNQKAQTILKEISEHKKWLEKVERFNAELSELDELFALIGDNGDSADLADINYSLEKMSSELEKLELTTLLSGPDDGRNAILTIHPGAGGTESQDWAGYAFQDVQPVVRNKRIQGEPCSIIWRAKRPVSNRRQSKLPGNMRIGYLKAESGVHRLVRISPFDANSRRHTSFVSVFVYPEVEDSVEIEIKDDDMRIDTYRASGAGGQHVNKTSSAVRITHIPTNIVVQCQNERSQIKNREMAMKMLRSRLYQMQVEEQKKKQAAIEKTKKKIEWGSQIRSYVFHPYNMVKDHRTDVETSNVQAVMDGNIDKFIEAYLADPDLREN